MSKIFVFFFGISIIVITFLNVTLGAYFDNYEPYMNAFLMHEFLAQVSYADLIPPWYLLTSFISFLSLHFPTLQVYSIFLSFFNAVILTCLLTCAYALAKHFALKIKDIVMLLLLMFFIYIDNIIYIHTSRLTFFLFFTAMLLLYALKQKALGEKYYFLAAGLAAVSILARIEILIIASGIALVFTLLFYRKLFKSALLFLFISIAVFSFYKIYQRYFFPEQAVIFKAEHEFEDRHSVSFDKNAEDSASLYKNEAIRGFIRDEAVLDIEYYKQLVNNYSLYGYFFNNPKFSDNYIMKMEDLWFEFSSHNYEWLLIFTLIIGLYAGFHYLHFNFYSKSAIFNIVFFSVFILSVPFIINLYQSTPYCLVVALWTSLSLSSLIFLICNYTRLFYKRMFFAGAAAFLIVSHSIYFFKVYEFQNENYKPAKALRNLKEHFHAREKTIVFANLFHYVNYPSRAFSSLNNHRIPHYNVDLYFVSWFSMYIDHNKPFFGDSLPYLKHRILRCANNEEIVFISSDDYNAFLKGYLKTFHDLEIEIKPIEVDFKLYELKPYFIVAEEKQRQQN